MQTGLRRLLLAASFFLLTLTPALAQNNWVEVASNYINSYSTHAIYSVSTPQGALYATVGTGVYRWSPPGWLPTGTGSAGLNNNGSILALASDPAGNIYATGWFTNSNGKYYIAKWNGTNWSELGSGSSAFNPTGPIYALATDAAGNIYAGGSFINLSGKRYVAKWNGTSWSELGSGSTAINANDFINAIATDGSGNVYAAGNFSNSTGKRYVAKWNGSTWAELGGTAGSLSASANILALEADASGNVYAGGQFANSSNQYYVAKWNGSIWNEMGTGANALHANYWIRTIKSIGGKIYTAGEFSNTSGYYVAQWNGTSWINMGSAAALHISSGGIYSVAGDADGNLYCSGDITNAGGNRFVAKWTAATSTWGEAGFNGSGHVAANDVRASTIDAAGNLYVGGAFINAAYKQYVAKWNGSYWSETGSATSSLNANGWILAMASDRFGNIYATGSFTNAANKPYIAKWDGNTWSEVGTGSGALLKAQEAVYSMITDNAGNLYVAGEFTNSSGKYYVAKWNGSTWSELGTGINALNATKPIRQIAIDHQGRIYATADHTNPGYTYYVAKWDGTSWKELTNGTHFLYSDHPLGAMTVDTAGHVYVMADGIYNSSFANYVSRWDGSDWSVFRGVFDFDDVSYINSDSKGNIYFFGDMELRRWNGTSLDVLSEVGIPALTSLSVSESGDIYGMKKFPSTPNDFYVGRYDPFSLNVPSYGLGDRCTANPSAKGHLGNPPYNGTVSVTRDGQPIAYNAADSSFTYFVNGSTPVGQHTVRVTYANSANSVHLDVNFNVITSVTPSITIQGSTFVTPGHPSQVTSVIQNGGASPDYNWQDSFPTAHFWNTVTAGTSPTFSFQPEVGVSVRCVMTSNATCATVTKVTSNILRYDAVTALPVTPTQPQLSLSPNPVDNILLVDHLLPEDDWKSYDIQDAMGRTLQSGTIVRTQTRLSLDVSRLAPATYFIVLKGRKGSVNRRFLKL